MATTCPVGFDVENLQRLVRAEYDRVAREPGGEFHFHRGLKHPASMLSYDARELAAKRTGVTGRAIGVDMTAAMIERAKRAAVKAGLWERVDIRRGTAEELPVASETIDVVISNGVLNLSPDKLRSFGEIHRVLKPGGWLHLADVVVQRELSLAARSDLDLWAA